MIDIELSKSKRARKKKVEEAQPRGHVEKLKATQQTKRD